LAANSCGQGKPKEDISWHDILVFVGFSGYLPESEGITAESFRLTAN
jgi:hypothetical protein